MEESLCWVTKAEAAEELEIFLSTLTGCSGEQGSKSAGVPDRRGAVASIHRKRGRT